MGFHISAHEVYFIESTPVYIPPLTYIEKKIIKNPNEFSG
jgi:hypothetical protein